MSRWRRASAIAERARAEGTRATAQRVVRRISAQLGSGDLDFPLLADDVADSTSVDRRTPPVLDDRRPLRIGWLCTPPGRNSGGHTTMFRMVRAFEEAGHACEILLYDRHHGEVARHEQVIRESWPWVRAGVRSVDEGFADLDACAATGWQTAHVLARRARLPLHRLYLIQDYEPFFYPHGPEYALAEDTYRFGFVNVALGDMVHHRLASELGEDAVLLPFSCDTSVYGLDNHGPRHGITVYAKPGTPRRGFRLAALALREFHARHPDQEIHMYGQPVPDLGVPVTHHGHLTPTELNALYNEAIAGLALSFTNISLIAEEMMAAGCVAVVNDSEDARRDVVNPAVRWARPTPVGLAEALSTAIRQGASGALAESVAAGAPRDDWTETGTAMVREVEQLAYARCDPAAISVDAPAFPGAGEGR